MRMVKIPSSIRTVYVNPIHIISAKVVDDRSDKFYVEISIDNDGGNNYVSKKMDKQDAQEELEHFVREVNDAMAS